MPTEVPLFFEQYLSRSAPAHRKKGGNPWENGYIESFNGKLRDELLSVEIFDTLLEAKIAIERWRWEYI